MFLKSLFAWIKCVYYGHVWIGLHDGKERYCPECGKYQKIGEKK